MRQEGERNRDCVCCVTAVRNKPLVDETYNIRQDLIKEEAKLNVIRDKMVADLAAQGVNPKYLTEMKAADLGKMLKR